MSGQYSLSSSVIISLVHLMFVDYLTIAFPILLNMLDKIALRVCCHFLHYHRDTHCKISHIFFSVMFIVLFEGLSCGDLPTIVIDIAIHTMWGAKYQRLVPLTFSLCTGSQEQNLTPNRNEETLDRNPVKFRIKIKS